MGKHQLSVIDVLTQVMNSQFFMDKSMKHLIGALEHQLYFSRNLWKFIILIYFSEGLFNMFNHQPDIH